MIEAREITTVAVTVIDNVSCVMVVPPLDEQEIRTLQNSGVLLDGFDVSQIDEPELPTTMIRVSDYTDRSRSPSGRVHRAAFVAREIAQSLEYLRKTSVNLSELPTDLIDLSSSPV
jgi:hypothetical protein